MEFLPIIILGLVLVVLPLLIEKYKLYSLISGYNTMPREKRDNFDWAGFSRFMRIVFHLTALAMVLVYLLLAAFEKKEYMPFFIPAMVVVAAIIVISVGNKKFNYLKKGGLSSAMMVKPASSTKTVIIALGIVVIVVVAVFYFGMKDPRIVVNGNTMEVKGMYGFTAEINKLEVDTVSALPYITMRTNGFAGGGVLKGYFKQADGQKVVLFVRQNSKPYLRLVQQGQRTVYISYKNREQTVALFKQLNKN